MITVPEIIILNTLKKVLKKIRTDYNDNLATPQESLLYRILNGNDLQRYKLFDQAVSVICTTVDNPRHIDINLFFNAKKLGPPTLHITLPAEGEKNNAIGQGLGFHEPRYSADGTQWNEVYNRRFNSKYNLIITSDNTNEVVLLYHFFRSIIISLTAHFTLSHIENIKLSGGDIQINTELVPSNIFTRAIGIDFEYDVEGQELFNHEMFSFDISVSGEIEVSVSSF